MIIMDNILQDYNTYKLAVDSAYNHIIITDSEGKVLYENPAVTRITGFTPEEIIGNNPSLWGRQMPQEFYEVLRETIKVKKQSYSGEIVNKRKNGEVYHALVVVSPILDKENNLLGFIGTEEDISDLKKVEDNLKEKNEYL